MNGSGMVTTLIYHYTGVPFVWEQRALFFREASSGTGHEHACDGFGAKTLTEKEVGRHDSIV